MAKSSNKSDKVPSRVINDRLEKSFKAGYSSAIEDLIDELGEWFKKYSKVKK